jgi:hypothetical protein
MTPAPFPPENEPQLADARHGFLNKSNVTYRDNYPPEPAPLAQHRLGAGRVITIDIFPNVQKIETRAAGNLVRHKIPAAQQDKTGATGTAPPTWILPPKAM